MRCQADMVTEILDFATKLSVTGIKFFIHKHSSLSNHWDETFLTN